MSLDNQTYTTNGNGYATDIGTWFMTYNNEQMWKDNFESFHSPNVVLLFKVYECFMKIIFVVDPLT